MVIMAEEIVLSHENSPIFLVAVDFTSITNAQQILDKINIKYINTNYHLQAERVTLSPDFSDEKRTKLNSWDIDELANLCFDVLKVISIYDTLDQKLLFYSPQKGKYNAGGEAKIGLLLEALSSFFPELKVTHHIALEVIRKCKRRHQIDYKRLNDYDNLLNTKSGIIDKSFLPKLELLPHSPDYYFTYCIPRELNDSVGLEKEVCEFLSSFVSEKDLILLYEIGAYVLVPNGIHKKGIITLGKTDAGKTVYTTFLCNMVGDDLWKDLTIHQLSKDDYALSEGSNKMILLDDDISSKQLADTALLKIVLGSKSKYISCNKKHSGHITYKNMLKIIGNANKLPEVGKEQREDAFFNRWWIINFPYQFVNHNGTDIIPKHQKKGNPKILDFISRPDILDAFFTKALLTFYTDVLDNGLTITTSMKTIQEEWLSSSNTVYSFHKKLLKNSKKHYQEKTDLYSQYKLFCQLNDSDSVIQSKFTKELKALCPFYDEYRPGRKGDAGRPYCVIGMAFSSRITDELELIDIKDLLDFKNKVAKPFGLGSSISV